MVIRMKKSRRRNNHLLKFILTFAATLMGITIAGIAGMLAYHWVTEENSKANADAHELLVEVIPENESRGNATNGENNAKELTANGMQEQSGAASEPETAGKYADVLADSEYMGANNIYAKETAAADEVLLAFGGDILFDPNYSVMAKLLQRPNGMQDCISHELMMEMQNADILMLNNEFPYSSRGIPIEGKQFTFRARPESVDLLGEMGVDIVSLANNHAYDYGEGALLDTFEILESAGIPYVGAGRNLQEAVKPVYFIAADIKIAIVSATQIERLDTPDTKGATETSAGVFRCLNPAGLLEAVAEAKENSDFVIVYIHWGTENTEQPDWLQLDQAPKLAKAGADLIIGDHPHCLQPIQYAEGVPVLYSLGNFWFNSKQLDTCLVKAVVNKEGLKSIQFLPAQQKDCVTSLLYGSEKERVLAYMRSISPGVAIDEDGYISQ